MKKRYRVVGSLFALAITLGYVGAAVAVPQGGVRECGNAAYYCGKIFGWGSWVCTGIC